MNLFQEKSKDTTNKVWPMFQNMFLYFINAEKFYNNLLFLNQKSISKIGVIHLFSIFNFLHFIFTLSYSIQDKTYEPAYLILEQIAKEVNAKPADFVDFRIRSSVNYDSISLSSNNNQASNMQEGTSGAQNDINQFIDQLMQFIDFRFLMMNL